MSRKDFNVLIEQLTDAIADKPLDASLGAHLNAHFGASTQAFQTLSRTCRDGAAEGWLCTRDGGGIRYGRVIKPSPTTRNFSVDVVDMRNIAGPHHTHPNGEIDLVMPVEGDARFDGHGAGWVVYGPGSAHSPTVTDGRALVLYLLPEGAIAFTPVPDTEPDDA